MSARQRVALVLGYDGSSYYGLQLQPGPKHPTVELELQRAFVQTRVLPAHDPASSLQSKVCNHVGGTDRSDMARLRAYRTPL